ncbi:MAG: class A beta-lactamase-related serine hydrolase [Bacteroidetes bacterium]|nr:class A beta-lactamase-related serine hydrolase [Bacteroidota bacterium]
MKKYFLLLIISLIIPALQLKAQDNFIKDLLEKNSDLFGEVLSKLDSFEVQIIYTQIDRDRDNFPTFTTYSLNNTPEFYFYPASTAKFPVALTALEKINRLNIPGLDKYTSFKIDSVRAPQSTVLIDKSSPNGLPSIAQYIKKIFLVSDNDAYNRLYEFVGQKEINKTLHEKGFKDLKIVHRFAAGFSAEENRYTNPITFYEGDRIIYEQPAQFNEENYSFELKNLIKGKGYLDAADSLINEPFDFTNKNYISLESLNEILKTVIFPESQPESKRFNLTGDDYKFLYKYMSMLPHESNNPSYDSTYIDSFVKFFMFNENDCSKKNIRIFNKVGLAYGFLTDIAYIVDFENGVEFMLSAVIHVNKNGIYNDNIYEYNTIGLPFFSNLGKVIYNYELTREREIKPDLNKFVIKY